MERAGALRHLLVPSATVYRTEGFAQRDFSEAPKFTQPLADCTTVIGYDTQLFCCVRASPKVSREVCAWLACVSPWPIAGLRLLNPRSLGYDLADLSISPLASQPAVN